MRVRLIALAVLSCCCFFSSGCSHTCETDIGQSPPPFKFCNFQRLGVELGWLYADLQDVIFGVTYYQFNQEKFPSVVYR